MRKMMLALVLGLALLLVALPAAAASGWSDGKTAVTFLGHAAFQLTSGDTTILIDPYLTGNPQAAAAPDVIKADYILVTHAHGDHLGDTAAIAKRTGAKVVATAEVARMLKDQGCDVVPVHIGAKKAFDFGYVRVTPAFHGSGVAGGHAAGFIVNLRGATVYHAGDTSLFGDMALLGKLEKIDCALLPIGDNYTMGPDDAVEAVGMLKAKIVVPMHYNTHALIKQDPDAFKKAVETRFKGVKVEIMKPGAVLVL
ncbi:MAG: metal-dependent hydrolase [Sporomusaceae bacterium]|nr:metal-dependent hydrolase [Sporomusaceae bacterium]